MGSYTNTCVSDGTYVYNLDQKTGYWSLYNQSEKVENTSFITISPDLKLVYSVNENGVESSVSSFIYEKRSGSLKIIDKKPAQGKDPCHIINDDENVMVANYSSGSNTVFTNSKTRSLNPASQVISHSGTSKNAESHASFHVHHL